MVKRTNSPFTLKVLECPLPPKFCLLQLESYDGLKDPLDHITTFKMTVRLNLFNHVLALFHVKFSCNLAIRYPVFR